MSEFSIGTRLTPMLSEKVLGEKPAGLISKPDLSPSGPSDVKSSEDFLSALQSAVMETNSSLSGADKAATDFAVGKADNLHDVMIAMEKADISLRTLTAVRGKVLEAYQEIMRMQV